MHRLPVVQVSSGIARVWRVYDSVNDIVIGCKRINMYVFVDSTVSCTFVQVTHEVQ